MLDISNIFIQSIQFKEVPILDIKIPRYHDYGDGGGGGGRRFNVNQAQLSIEANIHYYSNLDILV